MTLAACTQPTSPPATTSSWSAFRYDATHSGAQPTETAISTATVSHLTVGFRGDTGGAVESSPAVVNGVVYVGADDGKLYAFSATAASGCGTAPVECAPLWTAATGGAVQSSPAVAGGVVYVASADGNLYAFDAAGSTGCSGTPKVCTPLWTAPLGSAVYSSPTVVGGLVYVMPSAGTLAVFDATGTSGCSGTPKVCSALWTAPTGPAQYGLGASPAVSGGVVYVTTDKLYAFDASGSSGCSGSPKSCSPLWTGTTGNAMVSSPAVSGGRVYQPVGQNLLVFDAAGTVGCSGTPKVCTPEWTAPLDSTVFQPSSPAVADGYVYVSSGAALYAFDAAGLQSCSGVPVVCSPVWSAAVGQGGHTPASSSPSVANGVVFVGSDDGNLYAFDAQGFDNCSTSPRQCAPIWSGTTGGLISSSPAIQSGRVYVGSTDSHLYEFGVCSNPEASVGFGPCDYTSAYRLPTLAGSSTKTVAIVDAYDDPTAESDLAVYRSTYHLPPCTTANGCFTKLNQNGLQSSYPASDKGWDLEISLDVQMVSAICPLCHITLVEANSDSFNSLAAAQNTAAGLHPAVISDSFGGTEWSTETTMDSSFVHAGIQTVVATGDNGFPGGASYPAVIPSATAVGGTTLSYTGTGRGWSETVWNAQPTSATPEAAGSGCSTYELKPTWQTDVGCAGRTTADVSAVAANVAVYGTSGYGGWITVQGTSAATPFVAALWAITGSTAGVGNLYAHSSGLYDVTTGNNGPGCGAVAYLCNGEVGYDGPTGLGTPCGLVAWGGVSPEGCGGGASPGAGVAQRALATAPPPAAVTPACGDADPGHARCYAWVVKERGR